VGLRGPRPEPTRIRLLKNNPSKKAPNAEEPLVESLHELPPPPEMTGVALKTWHTLTAELSDLGMLTRIDAHLLTMYCETWADIDQYQKKIREFGHIIKAPSGYPMQSPFVNMLSKARGHILRMQAELGMTPSARSRVKVTGGVSKQTKLGKFLASRQA
jgi:P27 family predicted phage terminase small subunit